MDDLRGRVALVTGGTRGIGAATVRALLAAGADVTVMGRDTGAAAAAAEAAAVAAAEAASGTVGRALGVAADVRDPAALRDAVIASRGTLATIGSLAGAHAFAGGAAYNASKFGLVGLSEALMHDLRDLGVRVATVMPGSVATGFSPSSAGADDDWKLRPEDVAEAILYVLCNPSRALPSRIELRPARRRPARNP